MSDTSVVVDEMRQLQERSERLVGALGILSTTLDALADISGGDTSAANPLHGEAGRLRQQAQRLEQGTFRVLVVGDFNNGKSTLLNAIIGKDALPMRAKESTAIITCLRYGIPARAEVVFVPNNGHTRPHQTMDLATFKKTYEFDITDSGAATFALDTDAVRRAGIELEPDAGPVRQVSSHADAIRQAMDRFSDVEYAYLYDAVELCRFGVEIVDSPGLAASVAARHRTERWLRDVDAVIYVLNALKPLTDGEKALIETIVGPTGSDKVFFVINKWNLVGADAFDPEQDRTDVRDTFMHYLPARLADTLRNRPEQRIFFVNALGALKARVGRSPELALAESGVPELEAALATFLTRDRGAIEANNALFAARDSLATAERAQQYIQANLGKSLAELEAQRNAIQPDLEKMQRISDYIAKYLDDQSRSLQEQLVTSLQAEITAIRDPKNLEKEVAKLDLSEVLSGWVYFKVARDAAKTKLRSLFGKQAANDSDETLFARKLAAVVGPQIEHLLRRELSNWQTSVVKNRLQTVNDDLTAHLHDRAAEYKQVLAEIERKLDTHGNPIDINEQIGRWLGSMTGRGGKARPIVDANGVGIGIDMMPMLLAIIADVTTHLLLHLGSTLFLPFVGFAISGVLARKRETDVRRKIRAGIAVAIDKGLIEAQQDEATAIRANVKQNFDDLKAAIVGSIEHDIALVQGQIDTVIEAIKQQGEFSAAQQQRMTELRSTAVAAVAEIEREVVGSAA